MKDEFVHELRELRPSRLFLDGIDSSDSRPYGAIKSVQIQGEEVLPTEIVGCNFSA